MYELKSSEFFDGPPAGMAHPPGTLVRTVDVREGLAVSLVSLRPQQAFQVATVNDSDHLHFSCQLRGMTEVAVRGGMGREPRQLHANSLVASCAPGERFQLNFYPVGYGNVELRIRPDILSQLAGDEYGGVGERLQGAGFLHQQGGHARAREAALKLEQLLSCPQPSRLLVHAATLEFLAWNLQSLQGSDDGAAQPSAREQKLLRAAHERLLADLSDPPTIEQLSREVGLNQLKLKRGFKAMFGLSIYALFQRERMGRAKALLDRHGVSDTAAMLGYSNMSHFSAAFRKQHGMLPSQARRGMLA